MAELNGCDSDHMVCKDENIYCLAFYQKFFDPHCKDGEVKVRAVG